MSYLTERGSLGLRLVESSSGEKVSEFSPEGTAIRCFEWSADGKQLVYCNNRETVGFRVFKSFQFLFDLK